VALVVQKYGGSSVADAEKIRSVARRIVARAEKGDRVAVVVSAMGDTTDDLLKLAKQVSDNPSERELDALVCTGELVASSLVAMAIRGLGYEAISLSGAQAGIKTDANHSRAKIVGMEPSRVIRELEQNKIVIVAGFQGISSEMDVTTLGRGGSDTTLVALAASLKASVCERFTDVEGIYTADPRIVPEARPLKDISYEEMLEVATYGNKVMHPRAIELGAVYEVPIRVCSSFVDRPGTLIHGEVTMEQRNKVRSVAHDLDVAKVTVVGIPDRPGIAAALFEPLAKANVSVDTIVQNASIHNITDLTFTTTRSDLARAIKVAEPIARTLGAASVATDAKLGKISIIGTGMQNTPGYAARMFKVLSDEGINIQLISTSEIRITCIIDESRVKDAARALHKAFELDVDK
jgi:aspartate kinase